MLINLNFCLFQSADVPKTPNTKTNSSPQSSKIIIFSSSTTTTTDATVLTTTSTTSSDQSTTSDTSSATNKTSATTSTTKLSSVANSGSHMVSSISSEILKGDLFLNANWKISLLIFILEWSLGKQSNLWIFQNSLSFPDRFLVEIFLKKWTLLQIPDAVCYFKGLCFRGSTFPRNFCNFREGIFVFKTFW